jgi:hypothetical protein
MVCISGENFSSELIRVVVCGSTTMEKVVDVAGVYSFTVLVTVVT